MPGLRRRKARAVSAFAIGACAVLACPPAAFGQGGQRTAALGGVVLDERTLEPIAGARVTAAGAEIETGPDGFFDFGALPPGRTTIRVRVSGRPALVDEADLTSDAAVFYRFLIPDVSAVLSELLVTASSREDDGGLTAADLVARKIPGVPPLVIGPAGGTRYAPVKLRGSSSIISRGEPMVILDGIRLGELTGALTELSLIPARDVQEVTVLMGPAAAFLNPLAAHGVILVATKQGGEEAGN
jgi:hypothetical protein